MAWRISRSLMCLRDEIDATFPGRDKRTDGAISGYPGAKSSHNVNSVGVVNAYDFSVGNYLGGINPDEAEEICNKIRKKLHLIGGEAYVIYNRRIADGYTGEWRPYAGSSPHTDHFHVSTDKDYYTGATPSGLCDYDKLIDWEIEDMALSDYDIERIANKVLDTEVPKQGPDVNGKMGGTITLRQHLAYATSDTGWIVNEVRYLVNAIFFKKIKRRGGAQTGTTTLNTILEYSDHNLGAK